MELLQQLPFSALNHKEIYERSCVKPGKIKQYYLDNGYQPPPLRAPSYAEWLPKHIKYYSNKAYYKILENIGTITVNDIYLYILVKFNLGFEEFVKKK